MERHLSPSALSRFFSGQTAEDEAELEAAHLAHCRECRELSAAVVEELWKDGGSERFSEGKPQGAALILLEVERNAALRRLLARTWWAERKDLPLKELVQEFGKRPALRTVEMFETILADAAAVALEDPEAAEAKALGANALAKLFPETRASSHDHRGKAIVVVANCRRLTGDWKGAGVALIEARAHLARGTGEPALEARLLSIQASLASDVGNLESAWECLRRAAGLFSEARLATDVASTAVKEASSLLAAGRHADAMERAEEALQWVAPTESRLEILAQSLITECLAALGRPADALRTFLATLPLFEQLGGRRTEIKVLYLEALLLDAFGFARESEKGYRRCATAYMEAELYKDAYLSMLTLVASLLRREAWGKAAAACEDALEMMREAGRACHSQMIELWEKLLALVDSGRITEVHLLEARWFLACHWNVPARRASLSAGGAVRPAPQRLPQAAPVPLLQEPASPNPASTGEGVLIGGPYAEAMERCDRQLVGAVLVHCRGSLTEASHFLGIARNTLRAKIKRYGLDADVLQPSSTEGKTPSLSEADRKALSLLRARSAWAELSPLPARRQIARLRNLPGLHTREMFTTVISAASAGALEDPVRGEELALVAQGLAMILPGSRCPETLRHDLLGEVLLVVGNCRRLIGEWENSAAAFDLARGHLDAGTGAPALDARLLSVRASLASDTGNLQLAQDLLARAERIYQRAQAPAALASTRLKIASALLAGGCHAEALAQAEAVLRALTPREARLEMLGRSIITECLAHLGRPEASLRSLMATWPLYESLPGSRNKLKAIYLDALVLAALGYAVEAEAAWRTCIAGYVEAELYKDALLTMLTRFRLLVLRGELEQAVRACEEALALEERLGHSRTADLWRDLLARVDGKPLAEGQILEAQQALVRTWSVPLRREHPGAGASDVLRMDLNGSSAAAGWFHTPKPSEPEEPLPTFELPPPEQLANGGYEETLERFEKKLLAAGLAKAGGRIKPASRLLGMERNALRARIRKFGLAESA